MLQMRSPRENASHAGTATLLFCSWISGAMKSRSGCAILDALASHGCTGYMSCRAISSILISIPLLKWHLKNKQPLLSIQNDIIGGLAADDRIIYIWQWTNCNIFSLFTGELYICVLASSSKNLPFHLKSIGALHREFQTFTSILFTRALKTREMTTWDQVAGASATCSRFVLNYVFSRPLLRCTNSIDTDEVEINFPFDKCLIMPSFRTVYSNINRNFTEHQMLVSSF